MEPGGATDDAGSVPALEPAVMWIPPMPLEPGLPVERRPQVYRLVALAALALLLGG
jgi:hypothetical protein